MLEQWILEHRSQPEHHPSSQQMVEVFPGIWVNCRWVLCTWEYIKGRLMKCSVYLRTEWNQNHQGCRNTPRHELILCIFRMLKQYAGVTSKDEIDLSLVRETADPEGIWVVNLNLKADVHPRGSQKCVKGYSEPTMNMPSRTSTWLKQILPVSQKFISQIIKKFSSMQIACFTHSFIETSKVSTCTLLITGTLMKIWVTGAYRIDFRAVTTLNNSFHLRPGLEILSDLLQSS